MTVLTEEQALAAVLSVTDAAGRIALTRETGPYDVTELSHVGSQVVRAVEAAVLQALQQQPAVAWLRLEYQGTGRREVQLEPPPVPLPLREQAIGVIYQPLYTHPAAPTAPAQPAGGAPVAPPAPASLDVCTDPDNCWRCKAAPWDKHKYFHAGIPVGSATKGAPVAPPARNA